jgi:uncharacterized protein (DUF1015 family)
MVRLAPLRALRYADAAALPRVTSPPHDVIPPAQRDALRREPRNMVHLVLPEGAAESRFADVAARLAAWQRDGTLRRDAEPALYGYAVTSGPPDARRTMRAVFARVGLDAAHGDIRPHERTLSRKAGDRLGLRKATQCDLEPIWLLHRDPKGWVDGALADGDEVARFRAGDGSEHRLWRVTDPLVLRDVAAHFATQRMVIADGHHRYRSALEHFAATGRPEDAWILACIARDGDPGLAIEATHRVVRWGRDWDEAVAAARVAWQVQELPPPARRDGGWDHAARELLQCLEGPGTAVAIGRKDGAVRAVALRRRDPPHPTEFAVTMVQEGLLADLWGLEESDAALAFDRDTAECLRQVASAEADLAVLLPPEQVASVVDAAMQGRLMPPKATYFVPKPLSGLVLAPLDEA